MLLTVRMTDTIFAQATARGRAGIAVIRDLRPEAFAALAALAGAVPPPRARQRCGGCATRRAASRSTRRWCSAFPAPASFTGEDVAELHVHGSPAVCRSVLAALARCAGCGRRSRASSPGGR